MKRRTAFAGALAVFAALLPIHSASQALAAPTDVARDSEAVVMTGQQLPEWSRLAAVGQANTYPSGAVDGVRDAHNGVFHIPPDARTGVPTEQIAAFAWDGAQFKEIPVQVDERFPYFLANANSDFGIYSGTDEELTYQWDVESWKKTAGQCFAQYPSTDPAQDQTRYQGYPTQDPVPTLDDDDEIVFMASDAGPQAPTGVMPAGANATNERQEIQITDPLNPGSARYVYLALRSAGPTFNATNGYVRYQRDANADEWIDRNTFPQGSTEQLGSSNTGYGPNLPGTVCSKYNNSTHQLETGVFNSTDRFPRDGVTVSTHAYQWHATGRWMVREMHVAKPGQAGLPLDQIQYGEDIIDRWKGRAFQQNPDSNVSVVGFEDEQVNWEANSALLGERTGPVRAIRETWGADSGTNVTKIEYFYPDNIVYRYHLRVHPIPPDGLYTSWDYNRGVAVKYFNENSMVTAPDGVDIDGHDDEEQLRQVTQIDKAGNQNAFFDVADPTLTKPLAIFNWEQVSASGDNGSLVYLLKINDARSLENPLVVPYYRDDMCFDDGTGDNPIARPYPGEASTDSRVYGDRPCDPNDPATPTYRQGCFACHGVHFFFTNDTDNATAPKPTTELDGQQYQWAVPTSAPQNVGDAYANTVKAPLQTTAKRQKGAAKP
jgi:hypothetical protein